MDEMMVLMVGELLFSKYVEAGLIQKLDFLEEEKVAVLHKAEAITFDFLDEVLKSDFELMETHENPDEALDAKQALSKTYIASAYELFGFPDPFDNGTTIPELRMKHQK